MDQQLLETIKDSRRKRMVNGLNLGNDIIYIVESMEGEFSLFRTQTSYTVLEWNTKKKRTKYYTWHEEKLPTPLRRMDTFGEYRHNQNYTGFNIHEELTRIGLLLPGEEIASKEEEEKYIAMLHKMNVFGESIFGTSAITSVASETSQALANIYQLKGKRAASFMQYINSRIMRLVLSNENMTIENMQSGDNLDNPMLVFEKDSPKYNQLFKDALDYSGAKLRYTPKSFTLRVTLGKVTLTTSEKRYDIYKANSIKAKEKRLTQ